MRAALFVITQAGLLACVRGYDVAPLHMLLHSTPLRGMSPSRCNSCVLMVKNESWETELSGELEGEGTRFGRRGYWNAHYQSTRPGEAFAWYTGWLDLEPFWQALVPDQNAQILLPGIGNDGAMVDMFDSGYTRLDGFDYSVEAVSAAQRLFGERLDHGVCLRVADARSMPYEDAAFDAVLDKGTLDAVYLAGGRDQSACQRSLESAVRELSRVLRPGGVVLSVTAAAAARLPSAFDAQPGAWRTLWDGSPFITDDGYASINVDATMLAWTRL